MSADDENQSETHDMAQSLNELENNKMREKVDEEIAKILATKNSALLTFQKGSISKQIYDKIDTGNYTYDELIQLAGSEDQLYGQVKRINVKIKLAPKVPSSQTKTEELTEQKDTVSDVVKEHVSFQTVFSDEMKGYIPQKDGYIARTIHGTTDVKLMQSLYENKDFTLLIGDTGCGKTHLARTIAYQNKVPYMRVNMNGATTPEDLAGQWIPNPNPNSTAKYIWQDGVLTKFMRHGGIFVVDEINMAPADILSMLHSVTDDEKRLVLTQKDGEVIIANPSFWLVSTMNPDYEGTKPLNLALKDRFRILPLGYSDRVEKKLNIDDKFLELANKLRKSDRITTPVSTRDLIKYRDDSVKYGETVARAFFVSNFDETERPVVEEMTKMSLDGYTQKKRDVQGNSYP